MLMEQQDDIERLNPALHRTTRQPEELEIESGTCSCHEVHLLDRRHVDYIPDDYQYYPTVENHLNHIDHILIKNTLLNLLSSD